MRLRSTTSFWEKLRLFIKKTVILAGLIVAVIFVFNLIFGIFRQFFSQNRLNKHVEQREAELRRLEEENRKLKEELESVQKDSFLEEEAAELFGWSKNGLQPPKKEKEAETVEITPTPTPLPFYKKWLKKIGF